MPEVTPPPPNPIFSDLFREVTFEELDQICRYQEQHRPTLDWIQRGLTPLRRG